MRVSLYVYIGACLFLCEFVYVHVIRALYVCLCVYNICIRCICVVYLSVCVCICREYIDTLEIMRKKSCNQIESLKSSTKLYPYSSTGMQLQLLVVHHWTMPLATNACVEMKKGNILMKKNIYQNFTKLNQT